MKLTLKVIVLWLCLASYAFSQTLTPLENKVRKYIIDHEAEQIRLLERLVNINSGTENIQGVHKVGEILIPYFKKLGFKTTWVKEPPNMKRAATLVAKREGTSGKRLLLIGHLDTVFAKNSAFKRFKRKGDIAKGPGVIDDKGGLVVILYALKALHAEGALKNTSITVILTGDEEDSGKPTSISRKPLIEAAKASDIALDFEPAANLETATIARRGVSHWKIETTGFEAHSAGIFQKNVGVGAIFELARILNAMREKVMGEKDLTFNPGLIIGGTKIDYLKASSEGKAFGKQNVVAKKAFATGDFRFLTTAQKQAFETSLSDIVKAHLPGTSATLTFEAGIPAMQPTENNLALLKQFSETSTDLGFSKVTPLPASLKGAADISHIADLVSASLSGLGPVGSGAHSVIESIQLKTLLTQTERAAIFIYRLTHLNDGV